MDHEAEMQKAIDGIRAIAGPRPEPMAVPGNVIAARAVPMPPPIPVAPAKPAPTLFRGGPAAYTRPIPASPQPVQSPAPSQMQSPGLNPVAYKQYLASIGGPK